MSDTQTQTPDHLVPMLAQQAELTRLGLHDLRRRWVQQPDLQTLYFGAGEAGQQTIAGFPEDAFHGVAIFNPTGKNILLGFNATAAIGSFVSVPPGTLLVWPAQFTNLSLTGDTTGPREAVSILRLRYPPAQPAIQQLSASRASAINNQPADFAVAAASVQLLAANVNRRGMEIVNNGAAAVRLALGEAATKKHGLWLSASGGTWNGQLSGALWLGTIAAITDAGETTVAVVEA